MQAPFLPTYQSVHGDVQPVYGLHRLDHAVGNAPKMQPVLDYISNMTGWHEFAEFTAEDVGTLDSGVRDCLASYICADVLTLTFDFCCKQQTAYMTGAGVCGVCKETLPEI